MPSPPELVTVHHGLCKDQLGKDRGPRRKSCGCSLTPLPRALAQTLKTQTHLAHVQLLLLEVLLVLLQELLVLLLDHQVLQGLRALRQGR